MSTTFAVGDRVRKAASHDWEGTVTAVLPGNLYEVDWGLWNTFANNPYAAGELEPVPVEVVLS